MPRRPRIVIPGAPHHVTQRGNNRQPVFLSPDDRRLYLELLGRHAGRCGARVLAYCLMTNHVHLVAVPEQEDSLAEAFGRTHSEYALALNQAEGRSGHVWQNRFFSCPMSGSHLLNAVRYVELNPVRARLAAVAWEWPWSSARAHAKAGVLDTLLSCHWTGYFGRWDHTGWKEILAGRVARGGMPDRPARHAYGGAVVSTSPCSVP
jgi:putative transposase